MSLIQVENLPPVVNANPGKDVIVCVTLADLLVNDNGGELQPMSLTPVRWCTLTCEYLRKFSKKVCNAAIGIFFEGLGRR